MEYNYKTQPKTGIEQNSIQQYLNSNLARFYGLFEFASKLEIQNPEPHCVLFNLRMTDKKKIEFLEKAMFSLYRYSTELNSKNLEKFETLKLQIMNTLNENEKIRFGQIEFYNEQADFDDIMSDDLPF